jgi:hypothetical protein
MTDDRVNWLTERSPEAFERYRGKWVAWHNYQVVGVGNTAPEAEADARSKIPEGELVFEAIDEESDTIYGAV